VRRLIDFLTNMDARAWRSLAISFVLFGGVGTVFLLGAPLLGVNGQAGVQHWLALARGPWALPIAVGAFAALAFLGAPQFVLIAAAAVVFGPWTGSLYSWIGTFISSLIGFGLGRAFGGRMIRDLKSQGVDRFMALVGRNGLMASLIVRLVPAAKILLTAFAGNSVVRAFNGGGFGAFALLALAAAIWIGSAFFARRWLKDSEAAVADKPDEAG